MLCVNVYVLLLASVDVFENPSGANSAHVDTFEL